MDALEQGCGREDGGRKNSTQLGGHGGLDFSEEARPGKEEHSERYRAREELDGMCRLKSHPVERWLRRKSSHLPFLDSRSSFSPGTGWGVTQKCPEAVRRLRETDRGAESVGCFPNTCSPFLKNRTPDLYLDTCLLPPL